MFSFSSGSRILVATLGAAAVTATVTALRAQLTPQAAPVVFTSAEAQAGIVLKADAHSVFTCKNSGGSNFGLYKNQTAPQGRYWLYEYVGNGEDYPGHYLGRFLISAAELQASPEQASRNTLGGFNREKRYYAMTERDLRFKCGEGLSDVITCGDGRREGQEHCDDGNATGGDGCGNACTVEQGFQCANPNGIAQPSQCARICSNGQLNVSEPCDDGNLVNGDGCTASCTIEQGFDCINQNGSQQPTQCRRICSNGQLNGGEPCDDGNLVNGDGCTASCTIEQGFDCINQNGSQQPTQCRRICSNGQLNGGEPCDDGNLVNGDGCTASCTIEQGFDCINQNGSQQPTQCRRICSNGQLNGGEPCDDGNLVNGDGCTASCTIEQGFRSEERRVGKECRSRW